MRPRRRVLHSTEVDLNVSCAAASRILGVTPNRRLAEMETEELPPETPALPRLSVVDDDEDFHSFLSDLQDQGRFQVVGACYTGAQALERLPKDRPDLVIMDIRLPDMSGIDCTSKLKAILPAMPIVILTGHPDSRTFYRALLERADGYLFKPVLAEEFLQATEKALRGEFALAGQAVPYLIRLIEQVRQVAQDHRFTQREEQILACLFEGMQDKEIAAELGIGMATVHTHMHHLFEKLGVHSRQEIIGKYLAI